MKSKLGLIAAALIELTGCNRVGPEDRYEIVRAGGDSRAICTEARNVAEHYLSRGDTTNYSKWKLFANIDCTSADLDDQSEAFAPAENLEELPDNTSLPNG